jgi:hypothetical protein
MSSLRQDRYNYKISSGKWLRDLLVCWLMFWAFSGLGLAILAGTTLVPLWDEHRGQMADYERLTAQNTLMEQRLSELDNQTSAMKADPQYVEHIIRQEMNLRTQGEETVRIEPEPIGRGEPAVDLTPLPDWSRQGWFQPFLVPENRRWLMIFGMALLFAALMVSVGGRRRLRMPG